MITCLITEVELLVLWGPSEFKAKSGMYLIQNLFLSPDFHKYLCKTHVSDGFAAFVCRQKDFLCLFSARLVLIRWTDYLTRSD